MFTGFGPKLDRSCEHFVESEFGRHRAGLGPEKVVWHRQGALKTEGCPVPRELASRHRPPCRGVVRGA